MTTLQRKLHMKMDSNTRTWLLEVSSAFGVEAQLMYVFPGPSDVHDTS